MTACMLAVALAAVCPAPFHAPYTGPAAHDTMPAAPTPEWSAPADRWFAEDKGRHFAMSFAATGFTYGGARFVLEPEPALVAAAAATLALGVGKEIHDVRDGRRFSLKDMVWNAAGVALGLTLVHHIR